MKPYCPLTKQGCRIAGHDVYHKTADTSREWRRKQAKALKKSARQWAKLIIKEAA